MTSEKYSFNEARVAHLDKIIDAFRDGHYEILAMELFNGELIVGFTDLDFEQSPIIINLPLHLVERVEPQLDSLYDRVMLRFYPYKNIADVMGELILPEMPKVIFCPDKDVIDYYINYWSATRASYLAENATEQNVIEDSSFDIISESVS